MTLSILAKLESRFTFKPEGWEEVALWWKNDFPISFYSWECPPRQIQTTKKYRRWVNFDIDLKSVVNGKKLDQFTELPRIITQPDKEKMFIESIININPKVTYTKIIADTNAPYLFVKSQKILGKERIRWLSREFKNLLEIKTTKLLGENKPNFSLYSSLQKGFKKDYEMFFQFIYKSFAGNNSPFVPREILIAWTECMVNHIGLTEEDKKERLDILKRVIASYAAEGMVFQLLSIAKIMPNPVWVNWEEEPNLATTTQILRKRYGLKPVPIIYFASK